MPRPLRWIAGVLIAAVILSAAPVLALRWFAPPVTAFMLLDPAAGEALRYSWADWSDIAPSVPLAVIASEDQKFPTHFGFDLDSIRDALDDRQGGEPLRGASTISQQLAKNLFLWPGRSFVRKGIEAYFTVLIELALPKRRIVELYVNIAEFGPGTFGIGAAARHYFGKPPASISDGEAALLAAVLPNPKRFAVDRPTPYLYERQRWILTQMRRLRREQILNAL